MEHSKFGSRIRCYYSKQLTRGTNTIFDHKLNSRSQRVIVPTVPKFFTYLTRRLIVIVKLPRVLDATNFALGVYTLLNIPTRHYSTRVRQWWIVRSCRNWPCIKPNHAKNRRRCRLKVDFTFSVVTKVSLPK